MKPLLIIDPGHGGNDPGGGSNGFWKEKEMNLAISFYQFNRYKQLNIPVALTRNSDITLSPQKRAKIVRDSGASFCHSNHINTGGGDGAEIIHSIFGGKEMAEKLAAELRAGGQNIRRVFTRKLPSNPRQDYYFMHRNTGSVSTAIIEYGFADSERDDIKQIKSDWKQYAEAVVKGFCIFTGSGYSLPDQAFNLISAKQNPVIMLPANISKWRVYPLKKRPVKGNEIGFIKPANFNGLQYEVLANPIQYVYTIKTRDFGVVNIYAGPETKAVISKHY